jgi:hypothetical protein
MVEFSKEDCEKIIGLTSELKGTYRDVNLTNIDRPRDKISYTFYNITRNKNVNWIFEKHRDIYYPNQVLNIGVCLNDDYVGGDFILYGPKEILPKKAGVIYSFKNTREHEITKIESGNRYSLIIFLNKDNVETKINLI